jgi:hypothetical protein
MQHHRAVQGLFLLHQVSCALKFLHLTYRSNHLLYNLDIMNAAWGRIKSHGNHKSLLMGVFVIWPKFQEEGILVSCCVLFAGIIFVQQH